MPVELYGAFLGGFLNCFFTFYTKKSTSGLLQNAASLFYCEAPELFCGRPDVT